MESRSEFLPSRSSLSWGDRQGSRQLPYIIFSLGFPSSGYFSYSLLLLDTEISQGLPLGTFYLLNFIFLDELICSRAYKCHLYCDGFQSCIFGPDMTCAWLTYLTDWHLLLDVVSRYLRLSMSRIGLIKTTFPSLLSIHPFTLGQETWCHPWFLSVFTPTLSWIP